MFWIRNPKSKRNEVEEILDNLLFSYWLLLIRTIIDVKSWWETRKNWKATRWLRGFFLTFEQIFIANEWWISNRAILDITPLSFSFAPLHHFNINFYWIINFSWPCDSCPPFFSRRPLVFTGLTYFIFDECVFVLCMLLR